MRPPKPNTHQVLANLLAQYRRDHTHRKDPLHSNVMEAAKEWAGLQESIKQGEAPHTRTTKDGDVFWMTPYLDRLVYTLNLFLRMDEPDQNYVMAAMNCGIPWRGDGMEMFRRIVEETEIMREIGVTEYRKRALKAVRSLDLSVDYDS